MPRKARIIVPGAVHHVMSRGIDGRPIFRSEKDREKLLLLIEKNIVKSGYLLYAWSFMENHYHLVLRINNYPFKKFAGAINGPYAQYYRTHIETRGSLFQDRPKTVVCQDQNYLQELIRYVHLNPVRAGVIKSLSRLRTYKWTGHSVLWGRQIFVAQNCEDVLRKFSSKVESARIAYEEFCREGLKNEDDSFSEKLAKVNREVEDSQDGACFVIGNSKFIQKVLKEKKEIGNRIGKAAREGVTIDDIAKEVCTSLSVEKKDLFRKTRLGPKAEAKKTVALIAHREYQIPVVQIARYFNVSSQAVSYLLTQAE